MKKVVRSFLKNDEWKYLLVKHVGKDVWSLPGWHIDEWESIYKAMKREIKEELDLEINILWNTLWLDIENIKEKPAPVCTYKINFMSEKGKKIKKLEYIFLAEIKSWVIKLQEKEIAEYGFFSKEELLALENTYLQIKEILKKIA